MHSCVTTDCLDCLPTLCHQVRASAQKLLPVHSSMLPSALTVSGQHLSFIRLSASQCVGWQDLNFAIIWRVYIADDSATRRQPCLLANPSDCVTCQCKTHFMCLLAAAQMPWSGLSVSACELCSLSSHASELVAQSLPIFSCALST